MHELPFLQSLIALVVAGKFIPALQFILYRIASWFGVGFFWKKGKDSGQKRFYWLSFLIWLCSWLVIIYFFPKVWRFVRSYF